MNKFEVVEICPHCEHQIILQWDVESMGFKAFCPVCGNRLMLCDECQHSEHCQDCDYCTETDSCRYNPPRSKVKVKGVKRTPPEHVHIYVFGEYAFTPCKNAFNENISWWITKKHHTKAMYCFSGKDKREVAYQLSEASVKSYISAFENMLTTSKNDGLNNFTHLLVSVVDREILTETFDSLEAAQKQMRNEMVKNGRIPLEAFNTAECEDKKHEYAVSPYNGYSNRGVNHSIWDWQIIPTTQL